MEQKNIDEIDVRALFATFSRHKLLIGIITILFIVGSIIFVYLQNDKYLASTTIELPQGTGGGGESIDFLQQALNGGRVNANNEMTIFASRFLAEKALDSIDIGTRYFTTKNFKKIELYRDTPFIVTTYNIVENAYGMKFHLYPIYQDKFILQIDPPSKWNVKSLLREIGILPKPKEEPIVYKAEHEYGEIISTPWFKIKVDKFADLMEKKYSFTITPNKDMWKFIQQNITTNLDGTSTILNVTFEDPVALRAKEIANAMASAYLNQEIERKNTEAENALKFIDQQLNAINKALKKSQSSLEKFKRGNILVDISQKASITVDKLSEYQTKLQELEIQQNVLANLQEYMKNNKDISGISLGTGDLADGNLMNMVTELKDLVIQKKALLTEYTELHPDVLRVTGSIESLRNSILFTIKNSLAVIAQQKQSILGIINEYEKSMEALPEQEQKLANLTRTAMVNERVYSYLLEKRAETAILRSSTVSKTRIIDKAIEPEAPSKPNRPVFVIIGTLLGLIAGIVFAFFKEIIANTITGQNDLKRLTNIPIYGVIPFVKSKKTSSVVLEAYRALRTNLEFMRTDLAYQTLVVTSMVSGEGKTTVSANLARILAGTGKKVLLIDLDMRRANLSKFFDLENKMGVSTLLGRKHTLFQVIKQEVVEGVDVMPAGPVPPNPSELIMSEYAKEVFTKLRSSYDYIVLDSPPVGLVTDSAILMHRADASLFVVRQDYTKKEFIKHLNKIIADHKIEHVGIVLNGTDLSKDYGYGNKYGASKYY